jgi:chemosensory pili system protein ChpA (sensor histidine kinase/response regulator)
LMSSSTRDEILTGFAEEVKSYIPALRNGLDSLRERADQRELLEELHRLAHTIKGAASLMGVHGLSHTAYQLEEALEDLISGKLDFSDEAFRVMRRTIDRFEAYSEGLFAARPDERAVLRETVLAFRRMRGLPEDGDEEAVAPLLESVPEQDRPAAGTGGECTGEPPGEVQTTEPYGDLTAEFFQEAEEHLEDVSRFLTTLESQITETVSMSPSQRELVRQVRRSIHTVKGAAAVVGIERVSSWAHEMENLLDWLYEEAQEIRPELIALLVESADVLALLVNTPEEVDPARLHTITAQYHEITRQPAPVEHADAAPSEIRVPTDTGEVLESAETAREEPPQLCPEEDTEEPTSRIVPSRTGRTLRVDMERVDELVNLAGELMIALSAFDQKMDTFKNAVSEIELSRSRIREIARSLEVGYEVKAIQASGTAAAVPILSTGAALERSEFDEFDGLELNRYSEFNLIIRTLNESVVDVGAISTQLANLHSEFDGYLTRQRVLLSELQDKMMGVRMTPMSTITNRMHRTVREVAASLGKKVRLVIKGEHIELDRVIWEKLTDPLMHLLRNAVDHGIEQEALRRVLDKPPGGTLQVAASREGNQVVIRISDDGAGLNYEGIRRSARAAELSANVDTMSADELAACIFKPGFSTREDVTAVSGRGMGLDVVEQNIQDLKGSIQVRSWQDKGTQFTIRIPLTLATVRALLFTVGGRVLALALNEIKEIIRVEPDNISNEPEPTARIDDVVLPLIHMASILRVGGNNGGSASGSEESPLVLVLDAGGKQGALVIDSLLGQREIVIKSLGSHLRHVKTISGATIMGDGSVVPILNAEEILGVEAVAPAVVAPDQELVVERPLKILIVDDSVSIRHVVSRLMEGQGWRTATAKDGIEALERLGESIPDVIVLDIEMPRMNGYEFLNALRSQPRYRHIPVVVLTSRTAAKHRAKARALGARGFIVKPYDDNEFIKLVLSLTGRDRT